MTLISSENVKAIAKAVAESLAQSGYENAQVAAIESKRIAHGIELIHEARVANLISEEGAKAQLRFLESTEASYLAAQKVIDRIDQLLAIRAGFAVVGNLINAAIGFKLLPEG